MIEVTEKAHCCGCSACVQICPRHCITMPADGEGFRYPMVDVAKCVNCGLCEKVCPELHPFPAHEPLETYAAWHTDSSVRRESSSGGIFSSLAEWTIREGGVVFGARFTPEWDVVHGYAESMTDVAAFRGSKYMQSHIGTAYADAERFLKTGKPVLFSGTPCQVAGLHRYLRKAYDNLLTVDFVCHGVPSSAVFKRYLREVCHKEEAVVGVNFRDKRKGWKNYSMTIDFSSGRSVRNPFTEDPFMRGFLANLLLRPSCYSCVARGSRSNSDLTIGDFWGIDNIAPQLDDDRGISLVVGQTPRGQQRLAEMNVCRHPQSFAEAVRYNSSMVTSVHQPVNRAFFFAAFRRLGYHRAWRLSSDNALVCRLIRKIYRAI